MSDNKISAFLKESAKFIREEILCTAHNSRSTQPNMAAESRGLRHSTATSLTFTNIFEICFIRFPLLKTTYGPTART